MTLPVHIWLCSNPREMSFHFRMSEINSRDYLRDLFSNRQRKYNFCFSKNHLKRFPPSLKDKKSYWNVIRKTRADTRLYIFPFLKSKVKLKGMLERVRKIVFVLRCRCRESERALIFTSTDFGCR